MSGWIGTRPLCAAVVAFASLAPAPGAHGRDYDVAAGKLTVTASAFVGTAFRTDDRDPKLLADLNSSLLAIPGAAVSPQSGRNGDDGNLNFDRGDPVATVIKGYLGLGYTRGDYGFEASAQGWYDYTLVDSNHPWGNTKNGFRGDRPLSDAGALQRARFSGVALGNLFVRGHHAFGHDTAVDWRLGYQSLDWGRRMMAAGGLRELNPVDIPASLRPGALREQETRVTFPAVFARLGLSKATSVEAFYQLRFEPTVLTQCGTLFASIDFMADGCDVAMFGNLSDRTAVATDVFIERLATRDPSDAGQGGIALKHVIADWATEFGIYAAQFHSRAPFYSGTKSGRVEGPLYLPGDPGDLNPKYFTEYPEDVRMFGVTFETAIPGGMVLGEFTYRPNQPLQYNPVDLISAAVSRTAPTPLRALMDALPPGADARAWRRHEALQLQLGVAGQLPEVLGAKALSYGVELLYKSVPDLPAPSMERFSRSEVFGQGPVDGVCPPPAAPVSCSSDGYVSRDAFGYRLRASLRYPNALPRTDLVPAVSFGHDVSGWSGDMLLLEGRMLGSVSLQAVHASGWTAAVAWNPTRGGTYNSSRDRSTAQAYLSYQF